MMSDRMRWLAATALFCTTALLIALHFRDSDVDRNIEGCRAYTPSSGLLVAHAGGGLPDRFYANDFEALDLAATHRFRFIEIDFHEHEGTLWLGHDGPGPISLSDLLDWLDRHPRVRIVTDIKTNNVAGLTIVVSEAGKRLSRFIPQVYEPVDLDTVRSLGFSDIIFADKFGVSRDWFPWVNSQRLFAVTIPKEKAKLANSIRHPVLLYTVNEPTPGVAGLYTDCLIPL